ncbi:hypothetical protein [Micromonospora inositola]|uniref:Di-and tricarboxylate transporter n=1 Tax=Micromonospora inositola TaxID=47865 RepID=A0A1C5JXH4_9ACTN|nr:hypothetical protein [Micromonospora inositola]SCG75188.1 hypothetical protein GA0070613_5717 [Micromonospora inositola]
MLRRLTPVLLTLVVVALGITALADRPDTGPPGRGADFVVLAGVAGLRWDDVDPQTTPTLWRMAEQGSIGSLSVRSAHRPTCPVDGWLTLGAGNFAAWNGSRPQGGCPPAGVTVEQPDGIGANLPDQEGVVRYNQDRLSWGTTPGALPESVRCSVAVGPGAAVAAARPFGRVDRYAPVLPADPAKLLGSCVLSIVDLGSVDGEDRASRAAQARQADAQLARVLAARPPRSLVIVAGVSDTDQPSRLHVAVADGPGWERGWLTSASTAREGYLQLVDLAPTALATLGRPMPERLFFGRPAVSVGGRPADLRAAIDQPADADREAAAQRRVAGWFFTLLAAAQVALALAVLPLLRRARRHAGPHGPEPVSRRVVAAVELLLVAAALAVPAALLADAAPWWRGHHAGWWFAVVTALLIVGGTAAVRFTPGHDRTLGPLGAVAGLATLVVGVDVVTGSRLQLNGVVGYSALEGGRYAGLGTVGLGVFIAGSLLSAGWLAQRVRRAWRPMVMVAVGGAAVVVVGSPYLGADSIGAIALTAGVSVAAAISTGGWLTVSRLAWATMAGLAVTIGFAVVDVRRPATERGTLGRFLAALGDGTGGLTVHRASTANLETLVNSPLTVLALAGAALVWLALLQPWGGLMRLFGIYPAVRAAMAGTAVAAGIGGVLGGSALDVAGAAAALVVPMAALAALRVLDHSTDRTQPGAGRPGDEGPGGTAGGPIDGGDHPAGGRASGDGRAVEPVAGRSAAPTDRPDEPAGPGRPTGRGGPDGTAAGGSGPVGAAADAPESTGVPAPPGPDGRPVTVPAQPGPASTEVATG